MLHTCLSQRYYREQEIYLLWRKILHKGSFSGGWAKERIVRYENKWEHYFEAGDSTAVKSARELKLT